MKSYQSVPIVECGEKLVAIPLERFVVASPHPYEKLGAPYGMRSPYYVRHGVLNGLIVAQEELKKLSPGSKLFIFDAFRPVEVQQFMVDYTFESVLREKGLDVATLSTAEKDAIWQEVYQFWAIPSFDPKTPPPHSTGAAIDVTLLDAEGNAINMGGEIDEVSPRSHPNYYAKSTVPQESQYNFYRQLLNQIMEKGGFRRHPNEWWHFCQGDQMWAWLCNSENPDSPTEARYGRVSE